MVILKYFAAALENMWLKRQKGTDEGCSRARQGHLLSLGLSPKLKKGGTWSISSAFRAEQDADERALTPTVPTQHLQIRISIFYGV